jgi:hypothetical protein
MGMVTVKHVSAFEFGRGLAIAMDAEPDLTTTFYKDLMTVYHATQGTPEQKKEAAVSALLKKHPEITRSRAERAVANAAGK